MRSCADTGFILATFDNDPKSLAYIEEAKTGKSKLIIPIIVLAEATKKLMQRGVSAEKIEDFWDNVEHSNNINIIDLDRQIANEGAKVSLSYSVPLIDALIAATAKLTDCAILFSLDEDFKPLMKRKYLKVKPW